MNYDVVIGLEIHLELKTKTKMFSNAPCTFNQESNTACSEVDLAFPGTLPTVNKEAVKKALQACFALNLNIDTLVKFDRKNYYYSDLPKGYQITQQFHPIGRDGYLDVIVDNETYRIRLERIHMEEDTAKQFHLKNDTLIDFNRAGTPLIEIVSRPDMKNGKQARAYLETLRKIFVYLDISDAKMEEGSMRCDVNISLKPEGSEVLGTKVEIKNLNSISNVEKAIDYEIIRQSKILDEGGKIEQATFRFDEATKQTVMMRKKEGAIDYKYFPDANIVPIQLDEAWVQEIKENLPILPNEKLRTYIEDLGLNEYDANVLVDNYDLGKYFDVAKEGVKNIKILCNWIISELPALLSKNNLTLLNNPIKPESLRDMVNMIEDKTISSKQAKEVFELMIDGSDPKTIVEKKGFKQVSDSDSILKIVIEVLNNNEQSIIDYKNGKNKAMGYLVGQVMKASRGQANPALASQLVKQELDKR